MNKRTLKDLLYAQVARIGKTLSSPKRLELLELLAQGEKSVEMLATQADIDIRLASAHLKALREARLVETRRDGKYIRYRLKGPDVAQLWVALRETAEEHLVELRVALEDMATQPQALDSENRKSLLQKARSGEIVVIDVRPTDEFDAGHLPYAMSLPVSELRKRLVELPKDRVIVAYCRGPFCLMADEAVRLLRSKSYDACKLGDGVSEWVAKGMPLGTGSN